jgi:hypothetical protein
MRERSKTGGWGTDKDEPSAGHFEVMDGELTIPQERPEEPASKRGEGEATGRREAVKMR